MKKNQFILTTTLITATIIGAIADSADARRYRSAGRSRDIGSNSVTFDIDLNFEDEFVPGLYPNAISNYLHINGDSDGDGIPDQKKISSELGQTYDLLIQPCCNNPNLIGDEKYNFIKDELLNLLPNSFNNQYFDDPEKFLQYTILIDSASTNLPGFETINNGVFSFVIDQKLGLTGVSQIPVSDDFPEEPGLEPAQTFGDYNYEASFQDQLELSTIGVGIQFSSSTEAIPESSNIFSLISLGFIGTGLLLKRKLKN